MRITLDQAALNRLIGGDTEVEFELRNAVVNAFASRYIKGIVQTDVFQAALKEIKTECANIIEKEAGTLRWNSSGTKLVLHDSVRDAMKAEAGKIVSAEILTHLNNAVKEYFGAAQAEIDARIKKAVDAMQDQVIRAEVTRQVNERLKKIRDAAVGA